MRPTGLCTLLTVIAVLVGAVAGSAIAVAASGGADVRGAQKIVKQYMRTQPGLGIPNLGKRPPKNKTVAWVQCTIPVCQANALVAVPKRLGWNSKLYPFDLAGGPQAFIAAFDKALADKPDYIGFGGVYPPSFIKAQLAKAKSEGIRTASITGSRADNIVVCTLCRAPLVKLGNLQADFIIADARGPAKVGYAYNPNFAGDSAALNGITTEMKRRGGPDSKVTGIQMDAAGTPQSNASKIVSFFQANPSYHYVACTGTGWCVALANAFKAVGLSKKVKFIGGSPQPTDLRQIKNGQQYASIAIENVTSGWRVTDGFARLSIGEKIPKNLVEAIGWRRIFTKANLPSNMSEQPEPPSYQAQFLKAWHLRK